MKFGILFIVCSFMLMAQGENRFEFDQMGVKGDVRIDIDGKFPLGDAVDILFVVDDSGSMAGHQQKLSEHVSVLAHEISKLVLDFHVGVTSTSPNKLVAGALIGRPKFYGLNESDLEDKLKNRLLLGTDGDWSETVFYPVSRAFSEPLLTGTGGNKGFYRKSARLALVFVTDAADQSDLSAWQLADFLMKLKNGQMDLLSVSALISPSSITDCGRDDRTKSPKKIEEFTRILNGKVYNICETNKATIASITEQITAGLSKSDYRPRVDLQGIDLYAKPKLDTLRVIHGQQEILEDAPGVPGWTYSAKTNQISISDKVVWQPQRVSTKISIQFEPL